MGSKQSKGDELESNSKAAGFSDSIEPSSLRGVRHFWQYIVGRGKMENSGTSFCFVLDPAFLLPHISCAV